MSRPSCSIVSEHAPSWKTASMRPSSPRCEARVEVAPVEVVGDRGAGEVDELGAVAQVVDGDDVVDADRVQAAQQVGADHSGGAGDDDSHADPPLPNSSS